MRRETYLFFTLCALLFPAKPLQAIDQTLFDTLLKTYVTDDGWVNYSALRKEKPAEWETYLKSIQATNPAKFSQPERLAFWINTYNAFMIESVLKRPSLKKISEDFSIFDSPFLIAGTTLTLNDIEHRILRGAASPPPNKGPFKEWMIEPFDYRIHYALVCAAVSCPPLRNVAYTEKNVITLLKENEDQFIRSETHMRMEKDVLVLSALLKWYRLDYDSQGGVQRYLLSHLANSNRKDKQQLLQALATRFKKADYRYDWTLNDLNNKPKP